MIFILLATKCLNNPGPDVSSKPHLGQLGPVEGLQWI